MLVTGRGKNMCTCVDIPLPRICALSMVSAQYNYISRNSHIIVVVQTLGGGYPSHPSAELYTVQLHSTIGL